MSMLAWIAVIKFVLVVCLILLHLHLLREIDRLRELDADLWRDLAERRRHRIEALEQLAKAVLREGEQMAESER